ncbi:PEP-CTERM sorting domain-containing protein [Roseateles koreensis]|uniref:PEP-CTERM sorting domain-containing protein n=1 Tax=Roseateles koreensis TaxID=2987526 RepID=A0ABT5KMH2_9BURK|nr:PEP-CTERM sorting domain-containing protein [Roseateles koreensis]MDC8784051.1 PEP-CTERM sorting domain-containing protein [Roseateles koreensis]
MSIKKIAAAAALLALGVSPAFATITGDGTTPSTGAGKPGEMFLTVYDAVAKVSYTKDLGDQFPDQASFLAVATTAGYSTTWDFAGDANWKTYLANANLATSSWLVMGWQSTTFGTTVPGHTNMVVTVKNGDESKLGVQGQSLVTASFFAFKGQVANFYNAVNATGTHATQANGSSYNTVLDGKALAGEDFTGAVLTPTFNGNAQIHDVNVIGATANVTVQTNNTQAATDPTKFTMLGSFTLNASTTGNATLVYNAPAAAVPEPSSYALLLAGLMGVGFVVRRRQA